MALGLRSERQADEDFAQVPRLAGTTVHLRGGREVSIRLPFDDDAAVDDIVADGEMHHLDVEVFALLRQAEYGSVSF